MWLDHITPKQSGVIRAHRMTVLELVEITVYCFYHLFKLLSCSALPGSNELLDDHRALEPPDPIPNSEVKRCIADGSVRFPHVRVGHRQALILNSPAWKQRGAFLCAQEKSYRSPRITPIPAPLAASRFKTTFPIGRPLLGHTWPTPSFPRTRESIVTLTSSQRLQR